MNVLIVTALVVGVFAGYIVGLLIASRGNGRDVEVAYLSGHVDGYERAMEDAGVPE